MPAIERVGQSHPECCEGTTGTRGCEYRRVPGTKHCPLHGNANSIREDKKALQEYKLTSLFGDRVREMAKASAVKNLGTEIALCRVALETIYNSINSVNDMMLYTEKIEKLTKQISSLMDTWQKLQERNKELMSRDQVIAIFDELLEAIIPHITDPDAMRVLADKAYAILMSKVEEK